MAPVYYAPDDIITTKGDLIEFKRRILRVKYCHFAVYTVDREADCQDNVPIDRLVGDGITVGVSVLPGTRYRRCEIVEETIRELCKNKRRCRVNNLEEAATKKDLELFDPDVIVERAREYLRDDFIRIYNLFTDNCEHFATWCRYGRKFSCQVNDNLLAKAIVLISTLGTRQQTDPNHRISEFVRHTEEIN